MGELWTTGRCPPFLAQAKRRAAEDDLLEQQTLQASMAGVDGCVVILSDTTPTEADELEAPAEPEQFVLLDGIPQVCTAYFSADRAHEERVW